MTALWVRDLVAAFWAVAPGSDRFPRELRSAITWSQPLSVVAEPELRIGTVRSWLRARRSPLALGGGDRAIRGCLVVDRGGGAIFLDDDDPPAEQRLTLAHELGHFLADVVRPRRRAVERLGAGIQLVLDGRRPPTSAERIDAALAGVSLGAHIHTLERERGLFVDAATAALEERADAVALELLAPEDEALRWPATAVELEHTLVVRFGLPEDAAQRYARRLRPVRSTWRVLR